MQLFLKGFDSKPKAFRYPGGETEVDPARCYLDTLQRHGTRGMAAEEARARELWHGMVFEPDAKARIMLAMLEETGRCRVLLNTSYVSAKAEAGRIQEVKLADGRTLIADYFVDLRVAGPSGIIEPGRVAAARPLSRIESRRSLPPSLRSPGAADRLPPQPVAAGDWPPAQSR